MFLGPVVVQTADCRTFMSGMQLGSKLFRFSG